MDLKVWKDYREDRYLKLNQRGDGSVSLDVVDGEGHWITQGTILVIEKSGRIYRDYPINESFGFILDNEGRVEFVE